MFKIELILGDERIGFCCERYRFLLPSTEKDSFTVDMEYSIPNVVRKTEHLSENDRVFLDGVEVDTQTGLLIKSV